jgi:hypothetical protein
MDNLGKNWQLSNILFCGCRFTIGNLIFIVWLSTSKFFGYLQASTVHFNRQKFGQFVEPKI